MAGSSKQNVVYNDQAFARLKVAGDGSIVRNTWRELPPSSAAPRPTAGARTRSAPAPRREGSFLIEALVTAVLVLIVATGVLSALDAAGSRAASEAGVDRRAARPGRAGRPAHGELQQPADEVRRPDGHAGRRDLHPDDHRHPARRQLRPVGVRHHAGPRRAAVNTAVSWPEIGQPPPVAVETIVAGPVGAGGDLIMKVTGRSGRRSPASRRPPRGRRAARPRRTSTAARAGRTWTPTRATR